jgi:hypothetical protein
MYFHYNLIVIYLASKNQLKVASRGGKSPELKHRCLKNPARELKFAEKKEYESRLALL